MKEKLNILISNIKRLVSNDEVLYRIYLVTAVATVVVIGFIGIIPSSMKMISNVKLVMEMVETNKRLQNKLTNLKTAEESLNNIGSNIYFLEYYVPDVFNIQNYMIDFVFTAGDAEFLVSKMTPIKERSGSVDVYVSIIGNGDLVMLVSKLESLYRVSEIQELTVVKGVEYDTLSMTLRTYIMEKQ